jgi:hypothetical protein
MNGAPPEFACCAVPQVPDDLRLEAAWHATCVRPENGPELIALAYDHPGDEPLPPESITLLRSRFWPNGSALKVAFRGGDAALNAQVLRYANLWSRYANVSFVPCPSAQVPDIVVGYDQPGYWSYLGTDSALLARRGQSSLNLQGFDRYRMSESEWYRVVCHEFAHALAAEHEQMRPEALARLEPAKCYAYYKRTQGWDRAMVDAQILTSLDMSGQLASPEEDESIMMYSFPGDVTRDGRPIVGGSRITARDGLWMGKAYPGRGALHPHLAALTLAPSAQLGIC